MIGLLLTMCSIANANEIDDRNVAELFSVAKKIRSYGEETWLVEFTGDWKKPKWTSVEFRTPGEPAPDFRFHTMETEVLRTPSGNWRYVDFMKQFAQIDKDFKKGDKALVVLLYKDLTFKQFREKIFKPWIQTTKNHGAKGWTYVKHDSQWLAKDDFFINHGWMTGIKSAQDFVCAGAGDKNIVKIEGDCITFIPRTNVCFDPSHDGGGRAFLSIWQDENGIPLQGSGRTLKPGEKVTLLIHPMYRMPIGWQ